MGKKSDNRSLREILASMTQKEKLNYLWSYYKWVPVVVLVVIAVIGSAIGIIREKSRDTLLSGMLVNVGMTEAGEHWFREELLNGLGGTEEDQLALESTWFGDLLSSNDPGADHTSAMKLTAKVTAHKLDYALMDDIAYGYYENQDVFSSLEEVLTPELLTAWEERIICHEGVPLALDLTDTPFAEKLLLSGGKIYLAFPGNTKNTEEILGFVELLTNWE